jgi:phosphoribosylpyrophosphate synthetase
MIESFVKRTAIFLYNYYKNYHIDYIIIPKDSYLLINEIANELAKRLNLENPIPLEIIEKSSPKYIKINYDDPSINDWVINELEYILNVSRKRNYFKMKEVQPSIRKYLLNTHELNNFYLHKISNKNFLIVDDIITTDKTIKDVSDLLFLYEANDVHACTIFTRKS